jgi:pyridoxamine 5'-phosphate oxidase
VAFVDDPFHHFAQLYDLAKEAIPRDPNAMTVSSVGPDGRPSCRVVLLKDFDTRGFVFYTNLESRKGRELLGNPYTALCFHWPALEKQVRIEGQAQRVSNGEADAYFATRPRGSQVGAWASAQSRVLKSRDELDKRWTEIERKYAPDRPIPRPPFWSGFRVVPDYFEFWTNRANRLHDRVVFVQTESGWRTERLYP